MLEPAPRPVLLVTAAPGTAEREAEGTVALARSIAEVAPQRSAWLHIGPGAAPFPPPSTMTALDLHEWGRRHGEGSERPWPPRAKDVVLGLWLLRRRRLPVVIVGWTAVSVLAALHRHQGPLLWLPGSGPAPGTTAPDLDRLTAVVVTEPDAESAVEQVSMTWPSALRERRRSLLGWSATTAPPLTGPPILRAHGPADADGGLDLLGRALASVRPTLGDLRVRAEWARAPDQEGPSADDLADLEAMGVSSLIDLVVAEGGQTLGWSRAAVAVAPGRGHCWDQSTAAAVAASGAPVVGWADAGPPAGVPPERFTGVPFPDTAALGRALVSMARSPRASGPERRAAAAPSGLTTLLATARR